MDPLKIVVVSAVPFVRSGFGQQAHVLMRGLGLRGHEVTMVGMNRPQEGASVVWELPGDRIVQTEGKVDLTDVGGKRLYRIIPHGIHGSANNQQDVQLSTSGAYMLNLLFQQQKADAVITLQDTQNVAWMAQFTNTMGIPWFHWLPWDNIRWEGEISKLIMEGQMNTILMSDFTEKLCRENKVPYRGKIYHGVNTRLYKPMREHKKDIREELGFGAMKDKFIVSYIGQNEERKHLDMLVKGFKEFSKDKKDALLFMHTDVQEPFPAHWSYNIIPMVQAEGIDEEFKCSTRFNFISKYSERGMAKLYNVADVLASATSGEGFGLGALYGNACGIPSAITDSCTAGQLTGYGKWGWLSKAVTEYVAPGGYTRKMTSPEEMTKCLNEAYNNRQLIIEKGDMGRQDVLEKYDADNIGNQWADLVEGFFQKRSH
jgi:glycosyltransferase involved in cell wall biosynthesis